MKWTLAVCSAVCWAAITPALRADEAVDRLVREVMEAHGYAAFQGVKKLEFTFVVEEAGKSTPLLEARHVWDLAKQTSTVTWRGKTVTINLADSATYADGDGKAAYARWVNDSYWLIAPFKLRDAGIMVSTGGRKTVEGSEFETLEIAYQGVGLTPGDKYTWYVDPKSKLLSRWDYKPNAEKTMSSPRTDFVTVAGMKFSTRHPFADKVISFRDIKAER